MRLNYIKASDMLDTPIKNMSDKDILKAICQVLKSKGIDTTLHHYEMKAEGYERYGQGPMYTIRFKCPGDYLAYFAMKGHRDVTTLSGLVDAIVGYYFYDDDTVESGLKEMFESCGYTLKDMEAHAQRYWWGDGDDFIIYLENLDTYQMLYEAKEYAEYEEEEDEDWEDWEE